MISLVVMILAGAALSDFTGFTSSSLVVWIASLHWASGKQF